MQLIKPESKAHYFSSLNLPSNDQLIIVEENKMNLLAKSCFCPGLIALISNLIASSGELDDHGEDLEDWVKEYAEGMGHEIYRVALHEDFEGKTFNEIAKIVYIEYKVILFALEIEYKGYPVIRLNPSMFKVKNMKNFNYHIYMICEDKVIADRIEILDMAKENKRRHFKDNVEEKQKQGETHAERTENESDLGEYNEFDNFDEARKRDYVDN
jgi:hypothetical protein